MWTAKTLPAKSKFAEQDNPTGQNFLRNEIGKFFVNVNKKQDQNSQIMRRSFLSNRSASGAIQNMHFIWHPAVHDATKHLYIVHPSSGHHAANKKDAWSFRDYETALVFYISFIHLICHLFSYPYNSMKAHLIAHPYGNTTQRSHYLAGNHHASHFLKCPCHNHLLTTGTDGLTR